MLWVRKRTMRIDDVVLLANCITTTLVAFKVGVWFKGFDYYEEL